MSILRIDEFMANTFKIYTVCTDLDCKNLRMQNCWRMQLNCFTLFMNLIPSYQYFGYFSCFNNNLLKNLEFYLNLADSLKRASEKQSSTPQSFSNVKNARV